jgi:hypothetical protein
MTEGALGQLAERGLTMRGGPAPDEVFAACWPFARQVARLEKAARKAAKRKARKAAKRHEERAVEFRQAALEGLVATWAQAEVRSRLAGLAPACVESRVASWAEAGVRARFVELDPRQWVTPLVPVDVVAERYGRAAA